MPGHLDGSFFLQSTKCVVICHSSAEVLPPLVYSHHSTLSLPLHSLPIFLATAILSLSFLLSLQPLSSCPCSLCSYLPGHSCPVSFVEAFILEIYIVSMSGIFCLFFRLFWTESWKPPSSCLDLEVVDKTWLCVWRKGSRVGIGLPKIGQWFPGIAETRIRVLELPRKIFP